MSKGINVSTFDTFNPREYLDEYYTHIGLENESLLKFFAEVFKNMKSNIKILEFGGGPTVYQLISGANKAEFIHFADYLEENLKEIKLWKQNSSTAFNWSEFVKRALELEGKKDVKKNDIDKREKLLRSKITKFLYCDAFRAKPLGEIHHNYYDIVSVGFVPESITSSKTKWIEAVTNICGLVKENGTLLMTALKESTYWRTGKNLFPSVNINETDIEKLLNNLGFKFIKSTSIPAEIVDENADNYEGYKGMIFVNASKNKLDL